MDFISCSTTRRGRPLGLVEPELREQHLERDRQLPRRGVGPTGVPDAPSELGDAANGYAMLTMAANVMCCPQSRFS